jgi:hypothetical protein
MRLTCLLTGCCWAAGGECVLGSERFTLHQCTRCPTKRYVSV